MRTRNISLNLFLILVLFSVFGCAGGQVDPNYKAYVDTVSGISENANPTFSIECPSGGCMFKKLQYFDPRDRVTVSQKEPHPAWALAGTAVKVGAGAFIAHDFFDFATGAVLAAGTTYTNSYNDIGGNNTPINVSADGGVIGDTYPSIGNDYSVDNNDSFNSQDDNSVTNEPPDEPPEGDE